MTTVIVFGPTGNIGSVAAHTAQKKGAKVWLAMRDTQKPIPGLTPEQEKAGSFERVQADLTKPETVTAAVKTSGAKHAFIYLAHGSQDHMKATIEALKASGITFVVFLSSFTVGHHKLQDISPDELIPFIHARVELSLDEVYGPENYVAIRPGGFATNLLQHKGGLASGEIKMFGPNYKHDLITPTDMGRVSGTILAQGLPEDGQRKVFLYGPQVVTQKEGLQVVADVLGKKITVSGTSPEQALEGFAAHGVPKPLAEYMVRRLGDDSVTDETEASWRASYEEGVENVKKYTGQPATGFREWVAANQELFK
ncbi:hypothetical protein N0V93_007921 [Gnomoniopsis smithogilvyi]|uniref:NmrA-like domain-containing protein n=1 Tax=Gnomoniopsis smithogilvyi TaxID=1191159 RepID=A0A9W9CU99_9PEZI|nr:hypothetical protein N0V93_007921 [Gnomoniopsis smithogilvyi]